MADADRGSGSCASCVPSRSVVACVPGERPVRTADIVRTMLAENGWIL
jgi:hypothetical protein